MLSINSDEPQHLHVAWGWTQNGLIQYRDFFDNHTPLFHLTMAPLVAWIGEQADILFRMRLAMFPLFAATLGCTYWLGTRLYSRRAGLWAALLAGSSPFLLLKGSEFRADVLWMALWVATLTAGLTGRFTRGRALGTGLLLGATFAVSMKTILLLVALLTGLGLVLCLLPKQDRKTLLAQSGINALFGFAGLCVIPLAIVGFFAAKGALPKLVYCIFLHNTLPGHNSEPQHTMLFVLLLPVIVWAARSLLRSEPLRGVCRALAFLSGTLYLLFLYCFWPIVTSQDFLPAVPLLAVSIVPCVLRQGRSGALCLLLALAVQITVTAKERSPFSKKSVRNESLVGDVLRLTKPTDFVMDSKGETIFRRRSFYYVLETLTQRRMELGLITDTIPEDMVKTRTCVALLKRLPQKSMEWVKKHYMPVTDSIWVAGCLLPPPTQSGPALRRFEVAIAAPYVVASAEGPVQGTMDGIACAGPVFLNVGPHTYITNDPHSLAVFWAQAADTGFTPFHSVKNPIDSDEPASP